jgi:hypothetical protein
MAYRKIALGIKFNSATVVQDVFFSDRYLASYARVMLDFLLIFPDFNHNTNMSKHFNKSLRMLKLPSNTLQKLTITSTL